MKRRKSWMVGCLCLLGLIGCAKEVPESTKINDIMKEEPYLKVVQGEAYLQEEVLFDMEEDRAVVPMGATWGLPKYREQDQAGASYGEEGGAEVYATDFETNPELYIESYFDAVKSLNLTVKDIRDNGFDVKVVKKSELEKFENELMILSGMVVKDAYELTGVSIRFDDKFRIIKKEYQFEKKENTSLEDEKADREKCTQEFQYNVGKIKFQRAFKKVKKMIHKDI